MTPLFRKLASAAAAALGVAAASAQADILIYQTTQSLDGNATGDLVWHSNTGQQALWLMNGNRSSGATVINPPTPEMNGASIVLMGDFGGDGKADLLWRTPAGGYWLTEMNGLAIASTHGILADAQNPGGNWVVVQKGDFNGDRKVDLLWKNSATGGYAIWQMNGSAIAPTDYAVVDRPDVGFEIAALGDFNGDGTTDILWMHADGRIFVQLVSGVVSNHLQTISTTALPAMAGYTLVLVGDFDADGKKDLLWRNANNEHIIWQMNGAAIASNTTILGGGTTWQVVFGRDLEHDGTTDLIWRDSRDGKTGIWLMTGSQAHAYGTLIYANSGWTLKYMADFNGDNMCDGIFVNDTDGSVATWLIAGGAAYSYAIISPPNSGWSVSYLY
jgi:hypothetical protein